MDDAAGRPGSLLVSLIRIAEGAAAPSAPGSGHQAQGLDIDVVAAVMKIEEPAGSVLAQLIAAGMPARWPSLFAIPSSVRF